MIRRTDIQPRKAAPTPPRLGARVESVTPKPGTIIPHSATPAKTIDPQPTPARRLPAGAAGPTQPWPATAPVRRAAVGVPAAPSKPEAASAARIVLRARPAPTQPPAPWLREEQPSNLGRHAATLATTRPHIQPLFEASPAAGLRTPNAAKLAQKTPAAPARPETLTAAVQRMLGQGYSVQQVEGQIHRWHPGWSAARIHRALLVAEEPTWSVGRGAGQGRPATQLVPYYRGQKPAFTFGVPVYRNPEWGPSISDMATVGLTPSQLEYMRAERQANELKFGADLRWLANHPAVVAAVLATVTIGPEVDPYILATSDVLSGAAAGKALAGRHYTEAALDTAALGLGRFAALQARWASREAYAATKASAAAHAAERAIESHPGVTQTPRFLQQELTDALRAFRKARTVSERAKRWEVAAHRFAELLAALAAAEGAR